MALGHSVSMSRHSHPLTHNEQKCLVAIRLAGVIGPTAVWIREVESPQAVGWQILPAVGMISDRSTRVAMVGDSEAVPQSTVCSVASQI
jgi:hypothetical protein